MMGDLSGLLCQPGGRGAALASYTPARDGAAGCAHGERIRHPRPEPDSPGPLGKTGCGVLRGLYRRPHARVDPPLPPRGAAGRSLRGRVRRRLLRVCDTGGAPLEGDGGEGDGRPRGPLRRRPDDPRQGRGPEHPEAVLVLVPPPGHDRRTPRRRGPSAALLGPNPRNDGGAVLPGPCATPPHRDAAVAQTVK